MKTSLKSTLSLICLIVALLGTMKASAQQNSFTDAYDVFDLMFKPAGYFYSTSMTKQEALDELRPYGGYLYTNDSWLWDDASTVRMNQQIPFKNYGRYGFTEVKMCWVDGKLHHCCYEFVLKSKGEAKKAFKELEKDLKTYGFYRVKDDDEEKNEREYQYESGNQRFLFTYDEGAYDRGVLVVCTYY